MAWKTEKFLEDLYPGAGAAAEKYDAFTPRELAIVACAQLDAALAQLIAARLLDRQKEVCSFLGTDGDGRAPAATFGARIQLGYLLAVINDKMLVHLRSIKQLRNLMAHRVNVTLLSAEAQAALAPLRQEWLSQPVGKPDQYPDNVVLLADKDEDAARRFILLDFLVLECTLAATIPKVPRVRQLWEDLA